MKRKTLKKAFSAFLSLLMCMMTLLSISTPVFAATTVDAYMVDFPRDGDSNYSATAWGHSATSLMGGWRFLNSKYTTVHSIGTYNGQVSYCIEPGIGQNAGDTLSHKDETFWENYPSHLNPTISPDTIKVLLGRIMQYGYQGNVSTSWRSQNASDAAALSHAIATQLLVWETVVGERDASFNKVDPSGYGKSAVWSYIRDEHPLRSQIRSYYNSMAASVQSHAEIPSFCARSIGSARSYELKYDGTRYTGDDTDGTELQVAQPVILEVQLGPQWAGVEFQLKTDAGLYPGTIDVGQDGILRTELGNSGSYVLSCLTLNAAVPAPGDIPSPDVTQQEQEPLTTDSAENADAASQNVQEQDSGRPTVSGIPVMHIILFGGGLLLAVGALVAMRFIRNRRPSERSPYDPDDEDDDEDDYEY